MEWKPFFLHIFWGVMKEVCLQVSPPWELWEMTIYITNCSAISRVFGMMSMVWLVGSNFWKYLNLVARLNKVSGHISHDVFWSLSLLLLFDSFNVISSFATNCSTKLQYCLKLSIQKNFSTWHGGWFSTNPIPPVPSWNTIIVCSPNTWVSSRASWFLVFNKGERGDGWDPVNCWFSQWNLIPNVMGVMDNPSFG